MSNTAFTTVSKNSMPKLPGAKFAVGRISGGAYFFVNQYQDFIAQDLVVATTSTDATGEYRFAALAPDNNDPQDPHGHGTNVAGIIAAIATNSQWFVGAASVQIMPLRVSLLLRPLGGGGGRGVQGAEGLGGLGCKGCQG